MATETSTPSASVATPAGGDSLARLKRMSKTAGVGSHDYVAVNVPSVIAALAGVAALLALLSPILLVFALFAVVCAVIAIVQIVKSSGTQMGKRWAALGILLAAGTGGFVLNREYSEARAFEESKSAIAGVFNQFAAASAAGDHQKAYSFFGPAFQGRIKFDDFAAFLKMLEGNPAYGALTEVRWNQRLEAIQDPSGEGNDIAKAALSIKLAKSESLIPIEATLIRRTASDGRKGEWRIEGMPPLFEKPAENRSPQGGAGGQ